MSSEFVRIMFELDPEDWHGAGSETLWAQPVLKSEGHVFFQLDNSPYYTKGISYLDVVAATPTENAQLFNFSRVVRRSGHSTYMLLMDHADVRIPAYWNLLEQEGCSYESASIDLSIGEKLLYSVDVPPSANMSEVYAVLERGAEAEVWMFQVGFASPAAQE